MGRGEAKGEAVFELAEADEMFPMIAWTDPVVPPRRPP
jgi:hypothetical protein